MILRRFEIDGIKLMTKRCKSYAIVWETTDGRWVNKIKGIREGVEFTGKSKQVEVAPVNVVIADNSKIKNRAFR